MPFADPEFRSDIERMLAYHRWARGKYLDLFARLPWGVLTRKRGSTFESIRNVHLHVLGVYAFWLAEYLGQRELKPLLRRLDSKSFSQVRSVAQLRSLNRRIDEAVLRMTRKMDSNFLDRKLLLRAVRRPHPALKSWRITPREILWHIIEEDFLHTGEILCMLWQDDIEPPYTGVWWFEYDVHPALHQDLWYASSDIPRGPAGGYVTKKGSRKT